MFKQMEKMKTLSVSTSSVRKLAALEEEMNDFYGIYSDSSIPPLFRRQGFCGGNFHDAGRNRRENRRAYEKDV